MFFLDQFKQRYTTKKYIKNSEKINQQILNQLQEILRLTPSSINSQPWKFVFVTNHEIKQKLSQASFPLNQEIVKDCDCLIVFCGIDDILSFEQELNSRLPQRTMAYYNELIKPNGSEFITNWAAKQVYIALGVFLGALATMNIDSTPMEGINTEEYDKILNIKGYKTLVAVCIGKHDPKDYNQLRLKPKLRVDKEKVIIELL